MCYFSQISNGVTSLCTATAKVKLFPVQLTAVIPQTAVLLKSVCHNTFGAVHLQCSSPICSVALPTGCTLFVRNVYYNPATCFGNTL